MFQKLFSRKLGVAVLAAIASVILPALGVPAPVIASVLAIAKTYLVAQGAVDTAAALKGE